jgi:hypothetical protein
MVVSPTGLRQRKSFQSYASSPKMNSARQRGKLIGAGLSKEEADAVLQQLCEKDLDNKKTWSRVFVERYLLNVSGLLGT